MKTLDDFFRSDVAVPAHPRLRHWKERIDQGATATLELSRPTAALGLSQTEMNLRFPDRLETVAWDDDLNAGLIQLHVRAVNEEQEAERFALGLRSALRKAEREFGDGYLNAVLVDLVRDSDLTQYPEIDDVLKNTYVNQPERSGRSYAPCREMVSDAISGRAFELRDGLAYEESVAKSILVRALTRYLDERFSVTSRKRLGLL